MKKKIIITILVISIVCVGMFSSVYALCGKFGGEVNDEFWAKAWADKSASTYYIWVEARLHDTYGTKIQVAEGFDWDYCYVETATNWGIDVNYCYATYDYDLT